MRRSLFFFSLFFSCVLLGSVLRAEEAFVAVLDRDEISVGETATLVLSLKKEGKEEVSPPIISKIPGLFVFYRQTRQVLSPQGGSVSPATEFVYTLFSETPGTVVIPPIGIHVAGRLLLTKPQTLRVVGSRSEVTSRQVLSEQFKGPTKELLESEKISSGRPLPRAFARAEADPPRPYVHQPVRIRLWAYATVPFQYGGAKTRPENKGWVQIEGVAGEGTPEEDTEIREGELYEGNVVAEEFWFAQESGPSPFAFGEVELLLKTEAKDLFDRSYQEEPPAGPFGSHGERVTVQVDPVSLEIQPLPEENRPSDFSGAVGDFDIVASVDRTELKVGESAILTLRLRGPGNLKSMKDPSFGSFPFATSFQPRSRGTVKRLHSSLISEKTYELILIVNQKGEYTIAPLSFPYFNPKLRRYRTGQSQPIALKVEERPESSFPTPPPGPGKMEPELLGKDIYYLKKEVAPLFLSRPSLFNQPFFWGIQSVPLGLLGVSLFWRSYQLYLLRNQAALRRRRAFRTSQSHLQKAERHLSRGRIRDFARETQEAVLGYLSDKTGLARGGLSLEKIESLLDSAGADPSLRQELRASLEALQALQFAAIEPKGLTRETQPETLKGVLRQLEKIDFSKSA